MRNLSRQTQHHCGENFRGRGGFTLIELAACVAIVGLLAAAVGLSLSGAEKLTRFEDVVDQLRTVDALTRAHAQRFDRPTRLVFDLETGTITRVGELDLDDDETLSTSWSLPRGFAIERIELGGEESVERQVAIGFSPAGHSPTYALRLTGPAEQSAWLVAAGLTGQMIELQEEEQVHAMFEAMDIE